MNKPQSCQGCCYYSSSISQGFTTPSLPASAQPIHLLVISEHAGQLEIKQNKPLHPGAESGAIFARAIAGLGVRREQLTITNLIACSPIQPDSPNSIQFDRAVEHCHQYIDQVIQQVQPKAILALGAAALYRFTGLSGGKESESYLRGYVLQNKLYPEIPVICTYNPGFLRQGNMHLFGVFQSDIWKACELAKGRLVEGKDYTFKPEEEECHFNISPTLEQARALHLMLACEKLPFSYDIENPESVEEEEGDEEWKRARKSPIVCVGVSWGPGAAQVMPFRGKFKQIIQDILGLPNLKVGHNCFHKNTSVWTPQGWTPISTIQKGADVYTLDEHANLVTRSVLAVSRTKDSRKWINVRVDGSHDRGACRWADSKGITCTEDHKWISGGKRVEAKDLKVGDPVCLPRFGSDKLIEGCVLGDGHLTLKSNTELVIGHTNEAWARQKLDAFGKVPKPNVMKGGFRPGTVMWMGSVRVPNQWRERYYDNNRVKVWYPPSDPALAVWYCDDGCLSSHECATIAIHCFPRQQTEIKEWAKSEFGDASIYNGGALAILKAPSQRFFTKIAPYVPPCMEYKLPERFRGQYNGWIERPKVMTGWVKSIRSIEPTVSANDKYCLTVDGTHTFFTRGGLVSNSWGYDSKELAAEGVVVNEQGHHDTMEVFRRAHPRLPRSLQYCCSLFKQTSRFPWKHLTSNLEWYNAVDCDNTLRLFWKMKEDMEARGIWTSYYRGVYLIRPICQSMTRRGMPIDVDRLTQLAEKVSGKLGIVEAELQGLYPDDLKQPTQKVGYKNEPKSTEGLVRRTFTVHAKCCLLIGSTELYPSEHAKCKCKGKGWIELTKAEPGSGMMRVERWCSLQPFKPSKEAIQRYVQWKGLKLPVVTKKEGRRKVRKETADDDALLKLSRQTGDPFYIKVLEYRAYQKMLSTYCGGVPGKGYMPEERTVVEYADNSG